MTDEQKKRLLNIKSTAERNGGKCLSKKYENSKTKLDFKCKNKHTWKATAADIVYGKSWCPYCAGNKVWGGSLARIQKFAKSKGGRCLSEIYINQKSKLNFICKNKHTWTASAGSISTGKWCPYCNGKNIWGGGLVRVQKIAKSKGGKCLSKTYRNPTEKLSFVCKNKHKFFLSSDKIVFRNQWCIFCAGSKPWGDPLKAIQKICKNKGGKCISKKYVNNSSALEIECKQKHRWKSNLTKLKQDFWCPYCAGNKVWGGGLERLQKVAKSKGGKCLSTSYVNTRTKLEYECKNKHTWKAVAQPILEGGWCPYCAGKKIWGGGLARVQKAAKLKGGKCISKEYKTSKTKLDFQCSENHIFSLTPETVWGTKKWCYECTQIKKNSNKFHNSIIEYLKTKNARCISKNVSDISNYILIECENEHIFELKAKNLLNGSWCKECQKV